MPPYAPLCPHTLSGPWGHLGAESPPDDGPGRGAGGRAMEGRGWIWDDMGGWVVGVVVEV